MQKFVALFLTVSILIPSVVFAETDAERRARLQAQLQQVERQILNQRVLVDGKRQERQSLERDLDIIDGEITQAQLGIEARAVAIAQLSDQIGDKEEVIIILNERLVKQRASLAELIRQTQSVDDYTLVEVMLSNKSFSEFFTDVESFRTVKDSLNNSLSALTEIKQDTQDEVDHRALLEDVLNYSNLKMLLSRKLSRVL